MGARPPIEGSNVLLTGASSGIGRAMALQLAPMVRGIALVARRRSRLEALEADLLAVNPDLVVTVQPCDLADREAVDAMLAATDKALGNVDVLVNNAGFGDFALLEHADWSKLEQMLNVNVVALTYLTHALMGPMVARGRGGILNISSGFGLTFMPGLSVYVGSKHYVTGFTESLRIELAGTGVAVTQSCPGPVSTEFEAVAGNPIGRPPPKSVTLTADECARATLKAFARGKPLVVPGHLMSALVSMGRATPRPVMRAALKGVGGLIRRKALPEG
ncbi:MAG: SDR family NAD(P)-dependent oxidoreductase [Bradymonadia bacterium]